MLVFVSWSGETSRAVAKALCHWLPDVLQQVKPFMSAQDIQAGTRWGRTLGRKMEKCNFGVSCITADNRLKPWIMFEAGALSKQVTNSRVVPYLHKVEITDLEGPLDQFQAVNADEDGTLRLLESIHSALPDRAISLSRMTRIFKQLWPNLKTELEAIKDPDPKLVPPKRTADDMLKEILSAIRTEKPAPPEPRPRPHVSVREYQRIIAGAEDGFRMLLKKEPTSPGDLWTYFLNLPDRQRKVLADRIGAPGLLIEEVVRDAYEHRQPDEQ